MSKFRRQMSYRASLSYMMVTSVCSSKEWTQRTVLYGSTTAVTIMYDNEALYDTPGEESNPVSVVVHGEVGQP